MARRGVLFFIIWIICAAVAFGQSDDDAVWQEVLEQWAEQNDSETVPDDYLEQLQYFAESPINLNDTSSDLLQELLFQALLDLHQLPTIRSCLTTIPQ